MVQAKPETLWTDQAVGIREIACALFTSDVLFCARELLHSNLYASVDVAHLSPGTHFPFAV